jgi:hypothetical protein
MANCKLCKADIPEGMEFCEDCQDKANQKSKEDYLDSLLNSVLSVTPSSELIDKKENNDDRSDQIEDMKSDIEEEAVERNNNDINQSNDELVNYPEYMDNNNKQGSQERMEEESFDLNLDELLNSLDSSEGHRNEEDDLEDIPTFRRKEQEETLQDTPFKKRSDDELVPDFETIEPEDEDFLDLLKQISYDEPVTDDVDAINDLLKTSPSQQNMQDSTPSDVGEVFSDALKVVSSLKDYDKDEEAILKGDPDSKDNRDKKAASKIKRAQKKELKRAKKLEKKERKSKKKESKQEIKISLWKRLFGNVKDEKTAAKYEKDKKKAAAAEARRVEKENRKNKKNTIELDDEEDIVKGRRTSKERAADKKAARKAARKEKAEKKKELKNVVQVIDEIDEDPGRINRLGAAIVFVFFGIIATVFILGTKVVSYSLSIEHAANYFSHRKYTQAYNEVYGVDIKDEDIELYDKIMTVMYVNKQLNSYNNYYAMKMYPEALDSLLKGLSRYDKYIELATYLGIESDLNYVRSQLLAELENVYHVSEKQAMDMINTENREEYSVAIYDVVLENINN